MNLTKRQSEVLRFVANYFEDNGFSPTLKEIALQFEFGVSAAQNMIDVLVAKGYLTRKYNSRRSLIPKDNSSKNMSVSIPLLGFISAGMGVVVYEEPDPEFIEVPATMVKKVNESFCLKVSGWSMKDDGIQDGDIIVARHQTSPNNGDTVIAILKNSYDEKATLKRYYHRGTHIDLIPKNPSFQKISIPLEDIEIRGIMTGLIRSTF